MICNTRSKILISSRNNIQYSKKNVTKAYFLIFTLILLYIITNYIQFNVLNTL